MNKQDTQHNEEQDNEKVLADGPSKKNLKKIISEAKQKGYITQDQLEELVISEKLSSEQIEDLMTDLSGMGINVTENEESEYSEEVHEQTSSKEIVATNTDSETLDKTDDPVRMYLREMGSVELLAREGEIAIAKRIEAGRNLMINGLCESPLTFQAITIWRNELLNEEIMLRDVIDLETTFTEIGDSNELDAEIKKLDIMIKLNFYSVVPAFDELNNVRCFNESFAYIITRSVRGLSKCTNCNGVRFPSSI